ncbi:V-type ATP synthase subunit D [Stappia sp.]|uniref:V-type ATP synthase subunit D n=1 Tax=Stappia sp. TaxID=1870903 RepID=UPI0032D910C2
MARPALNKSVLARETRKLAEYRRFLPSLELKRQQIVMERAKAKQEVARLQAETRERHARAAADLPMLSNDEVALDDLLAVETVEIATQNLSGTRLPVLGEVRFAEAAYSRLGKPHWVDAALSALRDLARLDIARKVAEARLARLLEAEAVITRRVNLFEKVLIPQSEETIRLVRMALADAEREAVIRAKLSKRKTAARAAEIRVEAL